MTNELQSTRIGVIEVDTTAYPLILQRWHGTPSREELDAYFIHADSMADYAIASDTFFVYVVTGSLNLGAEGRRHLGAWVDSVPKARRARTLASYVVINNAAMRGMLTAMRWLSKNLADVYPMGSEPEAVTAALACLDAQKARA